METMVCLLSSAFFVLPSAFTRSSTRATLRLMARTPFVDLGYGRDRTRIPILYEDTAVLAIDKPAGWLLVPFSWQRTQRNLQAAISSSIAGGEFWARSRGLKFLRFVHRLDGDTTGVLLFAKSLGAVDTFTHLFESRQIRKTYLAVVQGVPRQTNWSCRLKLSPDPGQNGRIRVDSRQGKEAETRFAVLRSLNNQTLIEAYPLTGRTHQIRIHLRESGHPIIGDSLYGTEDNAGGLRRRFPLGLRAAALNYIDPFRHRPVDIQAPADRFLRAFGFHAIPETPAPLTPPPSHPTHAAEPSPITPPASKPARDRSRRPPSSSLGPGSKTSAGTAQ
jgi:RluA family pseudouridine synthase